MKKKLFKYIKIFVSMALILSLVAPSYASLSASDGSAFVTKAEFDSALADFNARLTTFEAGINSKIDSQVTSYLDRNGIWSKKEQTIVGHSVGNIYLYYPLGCFESPAVYSMLSRSFTLNGVSQEVWFRAPIPLKTSTDNKHEWQVIDEFNKSGMFVCTSAFTAFALNGSKNWAASYYEDNNRWHSDTTSKGSYINAALGQWYNANKDRPAGDYTSLLDYRNGVDINNSGFKLLLQDDWSYVTWFSPVMNLNIYFYENNELRCVLNPISQVFDSRKYSLNKDDYNSYMGMSVDSAKQPTPYVTQFFVTKGSKLKIKMALEWTGRLADDIGWFISPYDGVTSAIDVNNQFRPEWFTALQILENGVY